MGGVDLHLAIFCWLTLVCDFHFPISPPRMKPNSLISDQFIARYRGLYQRYLQHFWPAWLLIVKAIQEHNFSFFKKHYNTLPKGSFLFPPNPGVWDNACKVLHRANSFCTLHMLTEGCLPRPWPFSGTPFSSNVANAVPYSSLEAINVICYLWSLLFLFFSFFHLRQGILYSNPSGNRLDL